MNGYQGVFQRYEKKYLLDDGQYRALREGIQGLAEEDAYGKTTICNVYFDTPDYRLIRASLEHPIYKEKLRLRSYGKPRQADTVFVELKKKYRGVVYKRRVHMLLREATEYLCGGGSAPEACQITGEIDWMLGYYPDMRPAMYICYDRVALAGLEDPSLRLTFDQRILWRSEHVDLADGAWGEALLSPGERLLEIKIPGAMPLQLAHLLDKLHIYPVSYSKYGNAYKRLLQRQTEQQGKGVAFCA